MIALLRTNLVYGPTDLSAKLNEIIEVVNELDSKEPIVEVMKWDEVLQVLANAGVDIPNNVKVFFARRLK